MAGKVRVDSFRVPGANRIDLIARTCPVSQRYGSRCLVFDCHTAELRVCPFLYGLQVASGRHHLGEGRSLQEMRNWMATDEESVHREYHTLCLCQDPSSTLHGTGL